MKCLYGGGRFFCFSSCRSLRIGKHVFANVVCGISSCPEKWWFAKKFNSPMWYNVDISVKKTQHGVNSYQLFNSSTSHSNHKLHLTNMAELDSQNTDTHIALLSVTRFWWDSPVSNHTHSYSHSHFTRDSFSCCEVHIQLLLCSDTKPLYLFLCIWFNPVFTCNTSVFA